MAERRAKSITFKPGKDIAQWLDDLASSTGQDKSAIINTGLREYIKGHTAEEVQAHVREASQAEEEWPKKGGFADSQPAASRS